MMREWDENKLDRELEVLLNEIPEPDEFEKRIEKYINTRIRKIVHKTLAMTFIVVTLLLVLINPMFKVSFLNPMKTNEKDISIYFDVLRDYYETTRPYVELVSFDAEYKGLAHYDVSIQATNHRERLTMGIGNIFYDLNCGNIKNLNDSQLYLTNYMGRFDNYLYQNDEKWIEKSIDELRKLPESANVYISLYTAQPQEIEALRNSKISLEWIEVYQPNVEYRGGLNLALMAIYDETDSRDKMTETELLEVYRKNLKNLLEHKDVWKELSLPSTTAIYEDLSVLQDTYEDAINLTELKTERFTIYGEKADIIEFLENTDIISIQVDEITLY